MIYSGPTPVEEEIKSVGGDAIGVLGEGSDEARVAAMVERTVSTFGRFDAAFRNAGIQVPFSEVAGQPAAEFDRVNAVCPGTIDTPWVSTMLERGMLAIDDLLRNLPMERLGRG